VDVPIDFAARMDAEKLDKMLAKALEEQRAIYSVVAIMGSTEQGAVDPLAEIITLREKYQALGLSFIVHCDAAWGGYFASMIRGPSVSVPENDESLFVPSMALRPYTEQQLKAYKNADMITIDPHKYVIICQFSDLVH
jgi:glutamate/tyrosine decarboxylase-like PLP-dependent enzyme